MPLGAVHGPTKGYYVIFTVRPHGKLDETNSISNSAPDRSLLRVDRWARIITTKSWRSVFLRVHRLEIVNEHSYAGNFTGKSRGGQETQTTATRSPVPYSQKNRRQ